MTYKPLEMLEFLRSSIDKMLAEESIQASVHSIQLITSSTGESLSRPVSFILSCEPTKLENCIKEFTCYDEVTRVFTRSLASYEIDTEPYLADDLISAESRVAGTCSSPHQVSVLETWRYQDSGKVENLRKEWITCLTKWFPGRGSTLWVTQRFSASEQAPKSSAFVLFSGRVDRAGHNNILFRISKLLRDVLVTSLISAHQDIISQQQIVEATLLRKVLSESASEMPLAPEVADQMRVYPRAILSNIPILISGEAGTGKLAVARHIRMTREALLAVLKGHVENSVELIPAPTLVGSSDDIDARLRKALNGNGSPISSPVVIIDDVQVANPIAQDVLSRMLDEFIPGGGHLSADASRGKFVFTTLPGLDALVASGLFSASLYSQISAFEIVCPPLRERLSDVDSCRAILNYAMRAISGALELPAPASLTEMELEHIKRQHWPGNFRDLNNYLIRLLLNRSPQ